MDSLGSVLKWILNIPSCHFQLMVVKQRDKLENVMRNFLVEDRGMNGSTGYVEFLCHIHKEIRNVSS